MTEPYLATLNAEQRHAVEHSGDQPLLIIAGAGSGKTNTLAHRVAHLIVQRADPRRMMLLTFSRRAAAEMSRRVERIAAQVLPERGRLMVDALTWSGTFHAIGARLLREYSDQIGLDRAFTIQRKMGRSLGTVHAERVLDVLAGGGITNSGLAASWRRSGHLHALDPTNRAPSRRLTQAEVVAAQERLGRLLKVVQSTLDRLFLAVGGVGCSVLLADGGGLVVDRRGTVADDAIFEASGLWTGAVWSEKFEGTNGIGTCIVEKRPVIIDRDQHFFTRNSSLFCTTAPIFDEHGELAAALDVSSCRSDLTAGFARLIATAVADAAHVIEAENFRRAFPNARILLTPQSERAINSLLAVDRDDLVVGATRAARRALGLGPAALARPIPAADLIGEARAASDDIIMAERAALHRALARSRGNVSKAAKDLGMSRATLHRRLKQLGLGRRDDS